MDKSIFTVHVALKRAQRFGGPPSMGPSLNDETVGIF